MLLIRLNRFFGEFNAALTAIAIGLAALDYLLFLHWEIATAFSPQK
jgi:hypothetical protein